MSEAILLKNAAGDEAEVNAFGAELRAWRVGGEDMLWTPDPGVWDRTAPILFPVVGWTRDAQVRLRGRTYPLGLHGFAWKKRFNIEEKGENFLRLSLSDDEETRALYSFSFRFKVEFRLMAGALENSLIVTNSGDETLPYACGLHPAFRWPLSGSDSEHVIVFEKEEGPEVPIIGAGGLILRRKRTLPISGRRLALSQSLLANEAICFFDAKSQRLEYDNGFGSRLVAELQDFPHIAFWSLPPAPFLCIEAWTGHGDPEDFYGDLFEKPSMRHLAPGESARHGAIFRFEKDRRFD
jgi:galactose mutarotase-like enzyme